MYMALHTGVSERAIQRIKAKVHVGAALRSGRVGKCGRKRKTSAPTDRLIQCEALIKSTSLRIPTK